jgi:hypothetical protein
MAALLHDEAQHLWASGSRAAAVVEPELANALRPPQSRAKLGRKLQYDV